MRLDVKNFITRNRLLWCIPERPVAIILPLFTFLVIFDEEVVCGNSCYSLQLVRVYICCACLGCLWAIKGSQTERYRAGPSTEPRSGVVVMPVNRHGGSVAERLACWTQAQYGPGSDHSRDAVG